MTDISKIESAKELAKGLGIAGQEPEPDPEAALLAQQFGVGGAPKEPTRDLKIIEHEILFYKRQAGGSLLEIGRRLNEAKAQLSHGEWLPWLREKVDISQRSAQDFMRLAREYSKSAEIADLGASKALALLTLPASERQEFAAEKHTVDGVEKSVYDMTAKELKKAIEERDTARKNMEAMKARAEVAEQSRAKMEQDMLQLKELQRRAREAAEQKAGELRRMEAELKELKAKPVDVAVEYRTDPKQIAEAKAAGAQEAKQAAETARRKELAAAEEKTGKLREDLKKAREEAEAAQLKLQNAEREAREAKEAAEKAARMERVNSSQNMAKFSVLFQQLQDTVNRMVESVKTETPENQRKMRAAMTALAGEIKRAAEE